MATFSDSSADAAEAAEAVRGLAHALHAADHPRDAYPVLGELATLTHRMAGVTGQLADKLVHDRRLATSEGGDHAAGEAAVQQAVEGLRDAARMLGRAAAPLDRAVQASARVSWQELPDVPPPSHRYVNIVFLQGEEADRIIDTITQRGPDPAFEELAGYDFGDETVEAALENGYVYDEPPTGQLDRVASRDVYTMVYNPFMGHVGLYREHDALPDPVLLGIEDPPAHAAPNAVVAEPVREVSRADRLGTPRMNRASYPTRASLRGLGA